MDFRNLLNYDEILEEVVSQMGKQGFTQTTLAENLQVQQPYLNRVLNKKTIPSIEMVFKICGELGIQLAIA